VGTKLVRHLSARGGLIRRPRRRRLPSPSVSPSTEDQYKHHDDQYYQPDTHV